MTSSVDANEPTRSPGSLRGFCVGTDLDGARVYVRPIPVADPAGIAATARSLAGGPLLFADAELIVRVGDRVAHAVAPVQDIVAWGRGASGSIAARIDALLDRLSRPRAPFAGLPVDRPAIMGIVNVTPDSFSDGGDFLDAGDAIGHGLSMLEDGADLLDIGGESTRPGADPVPVEEELRRVLPVIRALAARGAVLSVDTRHAEVMRRALAEGAAVVNDVTGLTGDPDSLKVVAASGAPVILMHMQGDPRTMQANPSYVDAPTEIFDYLEARIDACMAAGISPDRIAVDPGIGFGKTPEHNIEILRRAALFHGLGVPMLIGVSRKRFIGALSRNEAPRDRVAGSLAAGLAAWDQGAQILRVHDVPETFQARAVWQALRRDPVRDTVRRPGLSG